MLSNIPYQYNIKIKFYNIFIENILLDIIVNYLMIVIV